jgi:hypothetical protein
VNAGVSRRIRIEGRRDHRDGSRTDDGRMRELFQIQTLLCGLLFRFIDLIAVSPLAVSPSRVSSAPSRPVRFTEKSAEAN